MKERILYGLVLGALSGFSSLLLVFHADSFVDALVIVSASALGLAVVFAVFGKKAIEWFTFFTRL